MKVQCAKEDQIGRAISEYSIAIYGASSQTVNLPGRTSHLTLGTPVARPPSMQHLSDLSH